MIQHYEIDPAIRERFASLTLDRLLPTVAEAVTLYDGKRFTPAAPPEVRARPLVVPLPPERPLRQAAPRKTVARAVSVPATPPERPKAVKTTPTRVAKPPKPPKPPKPIPAPRYAAADIEAAVARRITGMTVARIAREMGIGRKLVERLLSLSDSPALRAAMERPAHRHEVRDGIPYCKAGHPLVGRNLANRRSKIACAECGRIRQRAVYAERMAGKPKRVRVSVERMIELRQSGMPTWKIAETLGCSRDWAYRLMVGAGCDRPALLKARRAEIERLRSEGHGTMEIAATLGLDRSTIRRLSQGAK
jgi:transposase-like protein